MAEPASQNPTTVDMIRRFGGSTSPEIQWPEDDQGDGDGDDKFERMEKLIQRALARVTKTGKAAHGHHEHGHKGKSGGTGSGTMTMNGNDEDDEDEDDGDEYGHDA